MTQMRIIIEQEIKRNDVYCKRIKEALERLQHLLPVSDSAIENISFEDLSFFTVLTDRFSKLQDNIGEKIFKNILPLLKEQSTGKSMIDILHKLVQLDILGSIDYWDRFRDLRNQLAHEYPDELEITAKLLNETVLCSQELCKYWEELKIYLRKII